MSSGCQGPNSARRPRISARPAVGSDRNEWGADARDDDGRCRDGSRSGDRCGDGSNRGRRGRDVTGVTVAVTAGVLRAVVSVVADRRAIHLYLDARCCDWRDCGALARRAPARRSASRNGGHRRSRCRGDHHAVARTERCRPELACPHRTASAGVSRLTKTVRPPSTMLIHAAVDRGHLHLALDDLHRAAMLSTTTVKVVPFTTAASIGVSTAKCGMPVCLP